MAGVLIEVGKSYTPAQEIALMEAVMGRCGRRFSCSTTTATSASSPTSPTVFSAPPS